MISGPDPITPGCAGTPLSHQATESHRNASNQTARAVRKTGDIISDTLETTDRDPDGRQTISSESQNDSEPTDDSTPDTGSFLDISG